MRRRNVKNCHERLLSFGDILIKEPTENYGNWKKVFNNDNDIYVEIGMGKGDFLIQNALQNKNINYIGIEKFESVILQALKKTQNFDLPNLRLICFDANEISKIFSEGEVNKIFLNFSDPWPKNRHEKRRLTSSDFLSSYKHILSIDSSIEFKTDNRLLFQFSLMEFNKNNFVFEDLSLDLHQDCENIIMTEYEKKFHEMGHPIYFVRIRFKR